MSESNAFAPDVSDMGKHLFFVILGAVILIIVLIAIHFFVFKKHKKVAIVKHSYETSMVSDTQPHKPVENKVLDFPQDELKYSFTFFLEIDDFYSNKGYWKCIMIKGDSFNDIKKATLCVNSLPDVGRHSDITNCFQDEPVCDSFTDKTKCLTFLSKLKENIELDKENPTEGMNERLDVICRSLELDQEGKEILCKAASKCGLFTRNGIPYPIREGICQRFLDRHKDYCDNVYAIDKKVERLQDEDRIRSMTQNHDLAVEDAKTVQDYIDAKDRIEVEKRFDDYDNIYNLQHFLTEFQELLPKNLEELNENDLINLSEGHPLNQPHSVRNPLQLEGNYNFDYSKISVSKTNAANHSNLYNSLNSLDSNESPILLKLAILGGNLPNIPESQDISKINNEAEEKGYQYFGIQKQTAVSGTNYKYYFFTEEDIKNALQEGNKNLDENLYDADKRASKTPTHIFITKVKKPGETITKDCWKDVIESYPNQNPGVWLHPFVNDIRIVFTTNSEKPYQYFLARSPHATSTNHNNYHVSQRGLGVRSADVTFTTTTTPNDTFTISNTEGLKLKKDDQVYFLITVNQKEFRTIKAEPTETANKTGFTYTIDTLTSTPPDNKVYISDNTKQQHFYREFFDIKNIPIREEFHLAIIVNEKIVEVYINGGLTTTQQLFGNPNYNNGKLHISPQELDIANKKIKLGGIVRGFKYYPRTINYNNIKTLIENKKFRQTIGGEPDLIAAEHKHNLSLSHEHAYDQVEDRDHKHSVSEEDISKSFYSN